MLLDFFNLAGISLLGAKMCGFWAKWPPKRQIREKHLLGGHFLKPNGVFWLLCVKLSLSVWPVQVRKKKRREEMAQDVYISRMFGATPSAGSNQTCTCVRLPDVIKCAKFYRYNLRGFWAVRCWSYHVAIGNQGRPEHSAKRYRAAGDSVSIKKSDRLRRVPRRLGGLGRR